MTRRALVAYSASSTHVQTTLDYLLAFAKYSGFETNYVHSTHDSTVDIDFEAFDVVFHNYCSRLCFEGYVSQSYRDRLRSFSGVKILAVQDEYDNTDILKAAIKELRFDIVLTCVPQDSLDYVYPRSEFPDVEFITVFTGYVPDDFAAGRPTPAPLADRPILIGYRGRDIGGRYGRLGFDKFEIGRRMKEICDGRGIATDIAMDEASRIYGPAWFDFIGRCRAMLGSESGSNVFDFDGSIAREFKARTAANGGAPPSYRDFLPVVAARDAQIDMGQISPRIFECALMRTTMVLFRGRYSDAITPGEHYILLEKDFSNVDDVLDQLQDTQALEAMTQRAYDKLVGSGAYNYRTFFGMVGARATAHRKLAARAARHAPAGAAEAPSFVIENLKAVERASRLPDAAAAFGARLGLDEIRLLEAENSRLGPYFQQTSEALIAALAAQRRDCRATFDYLLRQAPQPSLKFFSTAALPEDSELERVVAEGRREDEVWSAVREERLAQLADVAGGGDPATRSAVIASALDVWRARYKAIATRFDLMNAVYERDVAAIRQEKARARAMVRRALQAAREAGELSPTLVVFAMRWQARVAAAAAIGHARRRSAQTLRTIISSPHVREAGRSIIERFPAAARRSRRLIAWLSANR